MTETAVPSTIRTTTTGALPPPEEDPMWERLRTEAEEALAEEPELSTLLKRTVLAPGVDSFEDAIARTVCYRILQQPCLSSSSSDPVFCPHSLNGLFRRALGRGDALELGHTMIEAVKLDALAVLDRDPACETLLEVVLFMKGFSALVCHRAARQKWVTSAKRSLTALWLQSQASAVFGLDIHPAATMGAGILLDHGTGIVIGETAVVGDGCTLLHGVTLGGTGKEQGDRHPKVGPKVLIGANTSILGNIRIGEGAKIGAGSIVLKSIPAGATAVGAPAKIIGRALEANPASTMDENLDNVGLLHKSTSAVTNSTSSVSTASQSFTSSITTTTEPIGLEVDESESGGSDDGPPAPATPPSRQRKACHRARKAPGQTPSVPPGCVCPFRDYNILAEAAPTGTVTIATLRALLLPEGCSGFEIGSLLFELDQRCVGYVRWEAFEEGILGAIEKCGFEQPSRSRMAELLETFRTDPSARPVKRRPA